MIGVCMLGMRAFIGSVPQVHVCVRAGKEAALSISRSRSERAVFFMRADSGSSSPAASPMTGETGSYTYMAPEVCP